MSLQSSNCNILGLAATVALFAGEVRFKRSSGHVLSKTKSVTPHFFYISGITNSSSFNGKIFRQKSMLEKFRANVLKHKQVRVGKKKQFCCLITLQWTENKVISNLVYLAIKKSWNPCLQKADQHRSTLAFSKPCRQTLRHRFIEDHVASRLCLAIYDRSL